MIHSLAGGRLTVDKICDIAKIKILATDEVFFCICDFDDIKADDIVLVPYGKLDELTEAKVLRIDKNVNSKNFPTKFEKLKKVYKK